MHFLSKDFYEEEFDINISNKIWWKTTFNFPLKEYENETKWNYWRKKNVAINLQTLIKKKNKYIKMLIIKWLKMFAAQNEALNFVSNDI